jgi:hypothetical protein
MGRKSHGAYRAFILLFALVLPPSTALAGQHIVLNGVVDTAGMGTHPTGSRYANGIAPSGIIYGDPHLKEMDGNTIEVINGSHLARVYGKHIASNDPLFNRDRIRKAVNNTVIVSDSDIEVDIYGAALNYRKVEDSSPPRMTVENNKVIVRNSTTSRMVGGFGSLGTEDYIVANGTIRIANNSVTLDNTHITHLTGTPPYAVTGGYGEVSDGNHTIVAEGNSVTIGNGVVIHKDFNVYGGAADVAAAGHKATVHIRHNTVTISGNAEVNGTIVGGWGDFIFSSSIPDHRSFATNNTVNISGTPKFNADPTAGTRIAGGLFTTYGGVAPQLGSNFDDFSGNTLNVHAKDMSIWSLGNFEYMNYFLPPATVSGDTVFTVSGQTLLSEFEDLTAPNNRQVTANVGVDGYRSPLTAGDYVVLIDSTTDKSAPGDNLVGTTKNNKSIRGMHGVTLLYDFDIWKGETNGGATANAVDGPAVNGRQLVASLPRSPRAAPESEIVPDGVLSDLVMLLNQGADLAAEQGIGQAVCAVRCPRGLGTFAALSGGWSRYDAGAHVDMSSVSFLAGLAKGMQAGCGGCLTLGAFFESGYGAYDVDASFSGAGSVRGNGNNNYLGGGVLARLDFPDSGCGHFYTEGSLRAGVVRNHYSTGLRDMIGREASYRSSTPYYGMHLGVGRVWNLTDRFCIDVHAKYFWTRRQGDSVRLSTGEQIRFATTDSHRARVGARLAYAATNDVSPYAGIGYEHEFAARARATSYGHRLAEPSLRGGTFVAEAGLVVKPSSNRALAFDLRAKGYMGKRNGVGGSLRVGLEF